MTVTHENLRVAPPMPRPRDIDTMPIAVVDRPERLVDLAGRWLAAEAVSVGEPGRLDLVRVAAERAGTYERALTGASTEDIRLAWHQAVVRQVRTEAGSAAWRTASRVSDLLRFEDEAAREAHKP
jgi:hypothetical protein